MILNTERLLVRQFQANDAQDYCLIESDPRVKQFMNGVVNRTAEEFRSRIAELNRDFDVMAIVLKKSGKYIGRCGLKRVTSLQFDSTTRELSFVFGFEQWHQQLAPEIGKELIKFAFQRLNAPEVIAIVDPRHSACVRVLEKIGLAKYSEPWKDKSWQDGFPVFGRRA